MHRFAHVNVIVHHDVLHKLVGTYVEQPATSVPEAFAAACERKGWNSDEMWQRLNADGTWYFNDSKGSYMYLNKTDRQWWLDDGTGDGCFVAQSTTPRPPSYGWRPVATPDAQIADVYQELPPVVDIAPRDENE